MQIHNYRNENKMCVYFTNKQKTETRKIDTHNTKHSDRANEEKEAHLKLSN